MLEILYDVATLKVAAWNADQSEQGHFHPTPQQDVVIFPIEPPDFESDWYKVNLVSQTIHGNPDYDPLSPDIRRAKVILDANPGQIPYPVLRELQGIYGRLLGIPD